MDKLFLTNMWNCDHFDVVELPNPFIVMIEYDRERHFVDVQFFDPESHTEAPYLFQTSLYVDKEYHDVAAYVDEHTIFTNFRRDITTLIVDDIVNYMKTGLYYDEKEYEDEPHSSFDLNYYHSRWEQYVKEYLENPDIHFS